jgi:hypothetical protein
MSMHDAPAAAVLTRDVSDLRWGAMPQRRFVTSVCRPPTQRQAHNRPD